MGKTQSGQYSIVRLEKIRVDSIWTNSKNNSPNFRAQIPLSPQEERQICDIGEHVAAAWKEELPKIKSSCEDSYQFRAHRVYGVHPQLNSKKVLSHWRDEVTIEASKKTGVLSREFGPSVLVEGGVKFLEASQKAKELLDNLIQKKNKRLNEIQKK